jgi:hypothetical protein
MYSSLVNSLRHVLYVLAPRVIRSKFTISDVVIYRKSSSGNIDYSYIEEDNSSTYNIISSWNRGLWNMKYFLLIILTKYKMNNMFI